MPLAEGPERSQDPDAELVARCGAGDAAAFRTLVARKLPRLHGLAVRMLGDAALADDVAQEALLRVWRHAAAWRPGEARFDTWLHRVVVNLCTDRLRRRREVTMPEPPEQTDPAPSAEAAMMRTQRDGRVREAVAALPERQRLAIILQTYQGLSQAETAAVMGVTVEALESLLARGRRALRTMLEGEG